MNEEIELQYVKIIEWHDGPLLFTAKDIENNEYVVIWSNDETGYTKWIGIKYTKNSFLDKTGDLLSFIENAGDSNYYIVHSNEKYIKAIPSKFEEYNTLYLPEKGYMFNGYWDESI